MKGKIVKCGYRTGDSKGQPPLGDVWDVPTFLTLYAAAGSVEGKQLWLAQPNIHFLIFEYNSRDGTMQLSANLL